MTSQEYLNQLQKYLKKLPQSDYEDAMEYFTEYFADAGPENEQAVIEELGTPKIAAAELMMNLLDKKMVLISVIIVLLCVALCVALFDMSIFLAAAVGVAGGIKLLLRGILAVTVSFGGFSLITGMGILLIGISILCIVFGVYLAKWMGWLFVLCARRITRKGGRRS